MNFVYVYIYVQVWVHGSHIGRVYLTAKSQAEPEVHRSANEFVRLSVCIQMSKYEVTNTTEIGLPLNKSSSQIQIAC